MTVSQNYDITSRILHWISAIIILWATVSGISISYLSVGDDTKNLVASLNVSLTTLFIPVFIFRVLNRFKLGIPSYSGSLSSFEKKAAGITHLLLYATTSIVLLSGWLMMEKGINVFGLIEFPVLIHQKDTQQLFSIYHTASTHFLALLIVLHVGAVINHELKGIRVFQRMALQLLNRG